MVCPLARVTDAWIAPSTHALPPKPCHRPPGGRRGQEDTKSRNRERLPWSMSSSTASIYFTPGGVGYPNIRRGLSKRGATCICVYLDEQSPESCSSQGTHECWINCLPTGAKLLFLHSREKPKAPPPRTRKGSENLLRILE